MHRWLLLVPMLVFPIAETPAQLVDSGVRELSKPEEQLIHLCQEMSAAFDKYYSGAAQLKDDVEREKYYAEHDPLATYVARLTTFERDNHGAHAGLMAARRLVLLGAGGGEYGGPGDVGRQHALKVLPDYANADVLPEIIRYLDGGNVEPASEPLLRTLINATDISDQNRQYARLMLATWALTMRDAREYQERRLAEIAEGFPLRYPKEKQWLLASIAAAPSKERIFELRQEALAILESLSKSNSPIRQPGIAGVDNNFCIIEVDPDKTKTMPLLSELASGLLFKEQRLRVGAESPELNLSLVSGGQWSLAEQRGKVVVLQFSFKGCGPCEAMYQDLRELTAKYQGQISIVSIMADEMQADTVDAVDSGKMSWNVHWDGPKGPIATKWAVQSFPTVYVIGPNGRIVARNLRGEKLKSQIAKLTR
jgi:thiol-disulfide isomerase/thioredoxin